MTKDDQAVYFERIVNGMRDATTETFMGVVNAAFGEREPPMFLASLHALVWAKRPDGLPGSMVLVQPEVALGSELFHDGQELADVLRLVGQGMIAQANALDAATPKDS